MIFVSGTIANKYLKAGEAWHRLHWVLGLRKLGFGVHFVEKISSAGCTDAAGAVTSFEESANLAYWKAITEDFGLTGSATLVCGDGVEAINRDYMRHARAAREIAVEYFDSDKVLTRLVDELNAA